jgi:hypothetical protein
VFPGVGFDHGVRAAELASERGVGFMVGEDVCRPGSNESVVDHP